MFAYGFAKSGKANLTADELATFRKAAKIASALSQAQVDAEVEAGRLMEVRGGDEDVQE